MERGSRDTDVIYVYLKQHVPSSCVCPIPSCNIPMEDNAILKAFNLSRAYVPSA